MKHQSFVYIQLNDQTLLFQAIPFCMSQQNEMFSSIAMYH